jgi:hypothetical protein
MTHEMRKAVRNGQVKAIGRFPKNQVLQFNMVLPLRDQAGLHTFLRRLYDPSSPRESFHFDDFVGLRKLGRAGKIIPSAELV